MQLVPMACGSPTQPVLSARAAAAAARQDPCMTEGALMLHDNCVDKPTPDNYTCEVCSVTRGDKRKPSKPFCLGTPQRPWCPPRPPTLATGASQVRQVRLSLHGVGAGGTGS